MYPIFTIGFCKFLIGNGLPENSKHGAIKEKMRACGAFIFLLRNPLIV
jgi:hypothetical protein